MVVGAFPVAKLSVLLVRQVSKPIAGYMKGGAKRSHVFRNYICLPIAQFYHRCETRYKLWMMGLGKPTQITPLNEQMAVELGADILGEVVIFVIAGALVTAEYVRSSAKAHAKEEAEEHRLANLESKLIELDLLCEQQRAQIRELERGMYASPLRTLKQKLTPGGSGQQAKNDQKSPSTQGSPASSSSGSSSRSNDAKSENVHISKAVRRAVKILLNTYEEVYDED